MKKIILSIGFVIAMAGFSGIEASNINVSVNIGVQPAWGPVGYNYAAFYYFPDINVYYNVNLGMFHYPYRGAWVSARYLPAAYRRYDLYGLYKVVLADNDPWRYNQRHMYDYRKYRGNRSQIVIRNSYDDRYRDSRRNEIRWYDDNHYGKGNNYYGNNSYGRDNRDNKGWSTSDRQQNRGRDDRGRNDYNGYSKSEDKRSDRSRGGNTMRYAEVSYTENAGRDNGRKSSDRNKDNSSRSDRGRSSSGPR